MVLKWAKFIGRILFKPAWQKSGVFLSKTDDKRVSINYKDLPTGFMGQSLLYRNSQSMVLKSLFLVVLMITMSLSAGIVQTSPATQPSEEESSGLSFMISYDSFEWD